MPRSNFVMREELKCSRSWMTFYFPALITLIIQKKTKTNWHNKRSDSCLSLTWMDNTIVIHHHLQGIGSSNGRRFRSDCFLLVDGKLCSKIQRRNLIVLVRFQHTGDESRRPTTPGIRWRYPDGHRPTLSGNRRIRNDVRLVRQRHAPTRYEFRSTCMKRFLVSQ